MNRGLQSIHGRAFIKVTRPNRFYIMVPAKEGEKAWLTVSSLWKVAFSHALGLLHQPIAGIVVEQSLKTESTSPLSEPAPQHPIPVASEGYELLFELRLHVAGRYCLTSACVDYLLEISIPELSKLNIP